MRISNSVNELKQQLRLSYTPKPYNGQFGSLTLLKDVLFKLGKLGFTAREVRISVERYNEMNFIFYIIELSLGEMALEMTYLLDLSAHCSSKIPLLSFGAVLRRLPSPHHR